MGKSDKLYSKSPKIEKDGDGKPGIKRPTEADAEDMGVGGDNTQGQQVQMPIQVEQMHDRHSKEVKDMHARHEGEHKDMNKRHIKELKKTMQPDNEGNASEEQ